MPCACAMQRAFYVTYFITPPRLSSDCARFFKVSMRAAEYFYAKKIPVRKYSRTEIFLRAGHVRRGISVCDRLRARR